jgi:ubiquinone/menaquinone biosynthesis C-methylase UbiE
MSLQSDRWSQWLHDRRDGGSEQQRASALGHLVGIRDHVLEHAEPLSGATLLDVGTGDGLIGLTALERVGPDGAVIFSDVSEALLAYCETEVRSRGLLDRARFVCTRAEDLAGIPDASVDVLTTRSVLIYVADKARAFESFARVLRPGGRISLFEPINRLMFPEPDELFWGYNISAVAELARKVKTQFAADDADGLAMMGFDDRDLLELARGAGFQRVHVECHIDLEPGSPLSPVSFDALLDSAPNPNAPTTREAIAAALTESERRRFLTELRSAFEGGRATRRMAVAYVVAHLLAPTAA